MRIRALTWNTSSGPTLFYDGSEPEAVEHRLAMERSMSVDCGARIVEVEWRIVEAADPLSPPAISAAVDRAKRLLSGAELIDAVQRSPVLSAAFDRLADELFAKGTISAPDHEMPDAPESAE